MELNKATIRKIIFIVFAAITFFIALNHLSGVWSFIVRILGILTPFIIGLCLAFVLDPLVSLLETKVLCGLPKRFPKKGKTAARGLSVFLSILIVAGIIALLILLVVPEAEDAFTIIGNTLPSSISRIIGNINSFLSDIGISEDHRIPTDGGWTDLFATANSYVQKALDNGEISNIANTALSVLSDMLNFALGIIFSIYVLMQKEKIGRFVSRFIRAFTRKRAAARIFKVVNLADTVFRNFVTGQLTEAAIIGALCFIGMLIFRFPYPTATSAVVCVMALVPVFGSWIGGTLGALLSLSQSFSKALLFVLFFVILQQLEGNLIYPKVVGKSLGLPGILVFIAVIVGGSVGGVLGILLSVPICSILFVLIKEAIDKKLAREKAAQSLADAGIPTDDKTQ